MCESGCEPSLDEILADPLIHTLMHGDGVDATALRSFLQGMRGSLGRPAPKPIQATSDHEWMTTLHERGRCMGARSRSS